MSSRALVLAQVVILFSTLLAVAPVRAVESWRTADLWGGDIRSLEVDPRDPDYLLAGTASGQVFVSQDAGESWTPAAAADLLSGWSVEALIFDPNQTQRVWAALTRVWDETGFVAMSDDRGGSWSIRSEGLAGRQVYSLAAVQGEPGVLYAGTRVGVYGTRDHGRSWTPLTAGDGRIQKVTSLLVDPDRRSTLLAGTWRRVYRTDDRGATWRRLDEGMLLDSEVFSLQPVPGRPGELWASTCGWVYRGQELGDRWRRFRQGLVERRTPAFRVLSASRLLAGTVDGIFLSEDSGESWRRIGARGLAVHALTHHPERPDRVFAGTEGDGVWVSHDGGRTFQAAKEGLSALHLAGLVESGGEVIVAVRHAGPASGVYSSFDGGRSYAVGPVRVPTVLAMASDGDRLYAATEEGLFERREGRWSHLPSLGEGRVDDLAAGSGRVLIRRGEAIWERRGEAFEELALDGIRPRAMALAGADLWLADADGRLYRLEDGVPRPAAAPFRGERLEAVVGRLLVGGPDGAWWGSDESGWEKLGDGDARLLPTGDARWPVLLASAGEGLSLRSPTGVAPLHLGFRLSPDAISDALLRDRHLLVATIGFGLLVADLESAGQGVTGSALMDAAR